MEFIRIQSLITLISHIFFIGVSFWGIESLRLEHFFKKNKVQQARFFYLMLAVALGFILSTFFLDFLTHSQNLIYFFQ